MARNSTKDGENMSNQRTVELAEQILESVNATLTSNNERPLKKGELRGIMLTIIRADTNGGLIIGQMNKQDIIKATLEALIDWNVITQAEAKAFLLLWITNRR